MLNVQFDPEVFREIIREELIAATEQKSVTIKELPAMLTRDELKDVLRIGDTKASELLSRTDFPVLREAGVLIPTHLLMRWIEDHTQWIQKNAKSFRVG
ncbi:MAG: DNA-binding protein [Niallia sp.]